LLTFNNIWQHRGNGVKLSVCGWCLLYRPHDSRVLLRSASGASAAASAA
jgi:hypothetical protein